MGDENRSPLADIRLRVSFDHGPDSNKITSPHLSTKQHLVESDQRQNFEISSPHEDSHRTSLICASSPTSGCQKKRHCVNSGTEDDKSDNPPTKRHKTRRGKSKKGRWNQEPDGKTKDHSSGRTNRSRRPERIAQADAPYNTTQFLIEDHGPCWMNLPSPDYEPSHSESSDKGDLFSSPEEEETIHFNRVREYEREEFQEHCRHAREEQIHGLSKVQLEQEYFKLEDRVEKLEHEIRELKQKELVEKTVTSGEKTSSRTPQPNKSPEGESLGKPAVEPSLEEIFSEESQSSTVEADEIVSPTDS